MLSFDVNEVLDRAKEAIGTSSDAELSRHLGKYKTTVTNYRNRGSLPWEDLVRLAESHNLSLDWLLLGKGNKDAGVAQSAKGEIDTERFDRIYRALLSTGTVFPAQAIQLLGPAAARIYNLFVGESTVPQEALSQEVNASIKLVLWMINLMDVPQGSANFKFQSSGHNETARHSNEAPAATDRHHQDEIDSVEAGKNSPEADVSPTDSLKKKRRKTKNREQQVSGNEHQMTDKDRK